MQDHHELDPLEPSEILAEFALSLSSNYCQPVGSQLGYGLDCEDRTHS